MNVLDIKTQSDYIKYQAETIEKLRLNESVLLIQIKVLLDRLVDRETSLQNNKKDVECHNNEITRFEVIDNDGRSYVRHNLNFITLSYQDNGKTLKVFLE